MSEPSPRAPAPGGRERILGRIRAALEGRDVVPHPGAFPGRPAPATPADAFAEAFRRAGGEVARVADVEAAHAWLVEFAAEHATAAVAPDVPAELRPDAPGAEPAVAALGVSRAAAAAADTGSLVMDSRGGRAVQLLPPVHLVWLDAADIHATLGEALEAARGKGLPPALALHSGPSKSADIGRIVVTGVHGPGRVVAVVIG